MTFSLKMILSFTRRSSRTQDKALKLVVTCYGDPGELKYGSHPTPALAVSKPIDQRNLAILLPQILGADGSKSTEEISITELTSREIESELKELRQNTNARCIVVSNQDGRVLVQDR